MAGSGEEADTMGVEKIVPTELRLDPLYIKVYLIYMNFIVHGIIPFITLILMNINIYRKVSIGRRSFLPTVESSYFTSTFFSKGRKTPTATRNLSPRSCSAKRNSTHTNLHCNRRRYIKDVQENRLLL